MTEGLSSFRSNEILVDSSPLPVGYWSQRRAWVVRSVRGGGTHLLRYSDFTSGYTACGLRPNDWISASLSGPPLCQVCAALVEMEQ